MNEKYFKTTGHGKIYEQDGIRKRATDAVWDIDYDGREMDVPAAKEVSTPDESAKVIVQEE